MKTRAYSFCLIFLVLASCNDYHADKLMEEARASFKKGDLHAAKAFVNSALEYDKYRSNSNAWYFRGYVYKDLYKILPVGSSSDSLREEAIRSILVSSGFDPGKTDTTLDINRAKVLRFLISTYYNNAVAMLATEDSLSMAAYYFDKYLDAASKTSDTADLMDRKHNFLLSLAGRYSVLAEKNHDSSDIYLERVLACYREVLQEDTLNWGANYNYAIFWYNRGVNIILNTAAEKQRRIAEKVNWKDPDSAIPTLKMLLEDPTLKEMETIIPDIMSCFEKALPCFLRICGKDHHRRKDVLTGMSGIYYLRNEMEEYQRCQDEIRRISVSDGLQSAKEKKNGS